MTDDRSAEEPAGRAGKHRGLGAACTRWLAGVVVFLTGVLLLQTGIAHADLAWSAPQTVDSTGTMPLNGVACPAATQCTAVDRAGQEVTYDPSSPGTPTPVLIDTGGDLTGIACPSASQCTAVDTTGDEITFNPQAPSTPNLLNVGVTDTLTAVACPSASQCTTVDQGGKAITFDPSAGAVTFTLVTGTGFYDLACPSTGQCTALESSGAAITFAPATGSNVVSVPAEAYDASGIACPSLSSCIVVGNGNYETFTPSSSSAPLDFSDQLQFAYRVACSSPGSCVGVSYADTGSPAGAAEVTFSPGANSSVAPTTIDADAPATAITCPTATDCVIVDGHGRTVSLTPGSGGSTPPPSPIDTDGYLSGVACPTAPQCTAAVLGGDAFNGGIYNDGQLVTFDPATGTDTVPPTVIDSHDDLTGPIACASATVCTAAGGEDVHFAGYAFGFSPTAPASAGIVFGDYLIGVSCPAAGECVGVDESGKAQVYDPSSRDANPTSITLGGYPSAVACPTTSQCTAVGSASEITFNPLTGAVGPSVTILSSSDTHLLTAIACPSATQCTAVDSDTGTAVTFNPATGAAISSAEVDEPLARLAKVACLSVSDCVAVDGYGFAFEGDPADVGTWRTQRVNGADALKSIACPTDGECVAIDDAGREFTGVPGGPAGSTGGGGGGGGGGGAGGTVPTTSTPSTPPASTSPAPPAQNPPGLIESVTTSGGQTITLTTALGEEGYAPLDQHLLGGLSANDIAKLLANGGFSVQIPLTYPAYPGNYSADGSANPQGIPGYDSPVGGGDATADTRFAGPRGASAHSYRPTGAGRRPAPVVLFRFSHTYTRAGIYKATIHFTASGKRLLRAAQKAHKLLPVTISLSLTAAGHVPFHQTLKTKLKPARARPRHTHHK